MRALLEPAAIGAAGGQRSCGRRDRAGGRLDRCGIFRRGGSGFSEAALGENILRTETAVCAALAAVQYAFGAFRAKSEGE